VLAVGDAEIQKKCIGKMKEVSTSQGRTILFVSHNMAAVKNLCTAGILMKNGSINFQGKIEDVIDQYISSGKSTDQIDYLNFSDRKGNGNLKISDAYLSQGNEKYLNQLVSLSKLNFTFQYEILPGLAIKSFRLDIGINDLYGARVAWFSTWNVNFQFNPSSKIIDFEIDNFNLSPGEYTCNIYCVMNEEVTDWLENVLPFSVVETDYYDSGKIIPKNQGGLLFNYKIKHK
jgi:lipopolysaccharide transport system ATP-binding protein